MTDRVTILIADDDGGIRDLLSTFLAKKGFDVIVAAEGTTALHTLMTNSAIDLAIVDMMMPGLTGIEIVERSRDSGCSIPIIIATAHGDRDHVVRALTSGADDFVDKPFDLAVLLARMKVCLRRSRPAAQLPDSLRTGAVPTLPPAPHASRGGPLDSGPVRVHFPPTSAEDIKPGVVLDGRYELKSEIGRGSFGRVWRAKHLGLESDVAVKLLHTEQKPGGGTVKLDNEKQSPKSFAQASDELRREGIRGARVQHPNAVRVVDVGYLLEGDAYLVMELLEGPTVEDLIKGGALPVPQVIRILRPVVDVLAFAHGQGVIHRDIKPANVLLHRAAGSGAPVVKVLDFGVAKLVGAETEIPVGHLGNEEGSNRIIAGSPAYLAPERLRGIPYDGRADVYSVGVMLFEMLTGQVPYKADGDVMKVALMHLRDPVPRPTSMRPGLSPVFDEVISRLMAKNPNERPTIQETAILLSQMQDWQGT